MRFATRLAAAVLGSGIAFAQAGHDDVVRVDPALKRLAGMITALGEPDAEGRIYSGRQAQGLKMVDDLGGLEDAIEAAAQMAGLPPKPKVVYPRRRFSLRDLLRSELGLGQVSRMMPALETLRTPLYLMP